jgi:hypothetical protein
MVHFRQRNCSTPPELLGVLRCFVSINIEPHPGFPYWLMSTFWLNLDSRGKHKHKPPGGSWITLLLAIVITS